ncbi:MAG: DNA gyrase subunit A [Thermomicrobiales bacterium]
MISRPAAPFSAPKASAPRDFATGRGRIVVRAKAFVEEAQRGNKWQIIVTELPYQVNKAVLMERIAEMVKDGRIDGISDMRDESDRSGMRMVIELKRDAQPMKVLNNLFKHSSLQQTFGVIMLALVEEGTQPRVLPLRRALQEYIGHRQVVIRRRTEYDLERARRRAHILEGLKIAFDNLDEVIQTIRRSQTTETARRNLMSRFGLSEIQANVPRPCSFAACLARAQEDRGRIQRKFLLIAELEGILADPGKVLDIIRTDMNELKTKYGDERRTRIQEVSGVLNEEDLIPEVDVLVTITNKGY